MSDLFLAATLLVSGQKYLVSYKRDDQRVMREAVMVYLETVGNDSLWDLRPLAGTTKMPNNWVIDLEEVDSSVEVYFDRKVKKA